MSTAIVLYPEFRIIPGFPGYRVGADGTILGNRCRGNRYGKTGPWKPVKPKPGQYGHLTVGLYRDKKQTFRLVHRLVLEAFVGPCPEGMECRHKNGNPADNAASNLAWGTHTENMRDKNTHGTMPRGEKHHMASINAGQAGSVKTMLAAGHSAMDVAASLSISLWIVKDIKRGRTWRHL